MKSLRCLQLNTVTTNDIKQCAHDMQNVPSDTCTYPARSHERNRRHPGLRARISSPKTSLASNASTMQNHGRNTDWRVTSSLCDCSVIRRIRACVLSSQPVYVQPKITSTYGNAYGVQLELHQALLSDIRRKRSDDTTVCVAAWPCLAANSVTVRHVKYFQMSKQRGELLQ